MYIYIHVCIYNAGLGSSPASRGEPVAIVARATFLLARCDELPPSWLMRDLFALLSCTYLCVGLIWFAQVRCASRCRLADLIAGRSILSLKHKKGAEVVT